MGPWPALAVGAIIAGLCTANPILTGACVLTLALLWSGAFRSPFLTIVAAFLTYQWLQVSMVVWIADGVGAQVANPQVLTLGGRFPLIVPPRNDEAVLLGLAALCAISLGARIAAPRMPPLRLDGPRYSPTALLVAYLVLLMVSRLANSTGFGGFGQAVIVMGQLRYAFGVLLIFEFLRSRRGGLTVGVFLVLEIALGLAGYFSNFKTAPILLMVGMLLLLRTSRRRILPFMMTVFLCTFVLSVVWTGIKPAYRAILNGGTGAQSVQISLRERVDAFTGLVGDFDANATANSLVQLGRRVTYTEYFARVISFVPESRPHEQGRIWAEALRQIVTPRFLFPDKVSLTPDSDRTIAYTGLRVARQSEGASIGIGYVGDSYIDFGVAGVILIPFGLGLFYGLIARHLYSVRRLAPQQVIAAVMIVMLTPLMLFETSSGKLFPSMVWQWAVCYAALALGYPLIRGLLSPAVADRAKPRLTRSERSETPC